MARSVRGSKGQGRADTRENMNLVTIGLFSLLLVGFVSGWIKNNFPEVIFVFGFAFDAYIIADYIWPATGGIILLISSWQYKRRRRLGF